MIIIILMISSNNYFIMAIFKAPPPHALGSFNHPHCHPVILGIIIGITITIHLIGCLESSSHNQEYLVPHCPKTWPQTSVPAVLSSIEVPMSPGKSDIDYDNTCLLVSFSVALDFWEPLN